MSLEEQKQAELDLLKAMEAIKETGFLKAQQIAKIGNYGWDRMTNQIFWSDELYRIFELDVKKVKPSFDGFLELIHPEDIKRIFEAFVESQRLRKPYRNTHRILFPDGRIKYVEEQSETDFAVDGMPLFTHGIVQDITERKLAEEALLLSEDRLRLLTQTSIDGIFDMDLTTQKVYLSPQWFENLGYNSSDYPEVDLSFFQNLRHPEDKESIEEIFKNHLEKNEPLNLELRFRHKIGSYRWIHSRGDSIKNAQGKPIRIIGSTTDITARKFAEENLRRNQFMMERAEQIAQVGSWEWDVPRDVITWSKELYRIHQVDPAAGVPNYAGLFSLFPKEDGERLNAAVQDALNKGTPYTIEIYILRGDGSQRLCLATGIPEKDNNGKVVRISGSLQDITARKKAEKILQASESKYRLLFENINASISIFDTEGNFLLVNEKYAQLIGCKISDLVGKSIKEMIPHRYEVYMKRLQKAVQEKKGFSYIDEINRKSGNIWLSTQINPNIDSNGNVIEIQVAIFSVTELKEAEAALIKLNSELESRVQIRTNELLAARDEAEFANRAKSLFLANMSHEIRTPMNGALGMLNLLLRSDLNKRQFEYASKAQVSTQTLLGIINDILDFSKIESGKMELFQEPFLFAELIQQLSILTLENLGEKNIEILFDIDRKIPSTLIGDDLRLRQVLLNLLGNAMKFTQEGEVILKIMLLEQTVDSVTLAFSISDSGIGIPENKLKHIFEGFSQAESSTTKEYGGTGLGLAISSHMVKLMGGQIEVRSEIGKGSIFSFKVNFNMAVASPNQVSTKIPTVNMLIIDDNVVACEILGRMAKSFDWTNDCLISKEKIIDITSNLNVKKYDIVLINWKIVVMNCLEVISLIRKNKSLKNLPIIIMISAYDHEKITQQIGELSPALESYLIKPLTPLSLLENVQACVSGISDLGETNNSLNGSTKSPEYLSGKKILLAEDNTINQQIVTELLLECGVSVDIAENGLKAVEMAISKKYHLILMDMQMPILDGIESTIQIRSHKNLSNVPIIAITANVSQKDRDICAQAGMNGFLPKPFEFDSLFEVLNTWLNPHNELITQQKIDVQIAISGIDMERGIRLCRGKKESYFKLLSIFLELHINDGHKIIEAVKNSDTSGALFIIHSLKGTSAQIGANDISKYAESLEIAIKENSDANVIENKIEKLKAELDSFGTKIRQTISSSQL